MPNIKSAIKRLKSDAAKRTRNQAALSELKTLSQKLAKLESDPAKAAEYAPQVIAKLDKAVSRGIIPRGRADRKKARITAFVKKISSKSAK